MSTFVTVGNASRPFDRLLKAVAAITTGLPPPIIVQRGGSCVSSGSWVMHDYLGMGIFESMVRDADVLIMHGGAGSIIHALSCGKRPVVMPRRSKYGEVLDDHQLQFVLELQREGYLVLANEPEDLMKAVRQASLGGSSREPRVVPPLTAEISRLFTEWAGRAPVSS